MTELITYKKQNTSYYSDSALWAEFWYDDKMWLLDIDQSDLINLLHDANCYFVKRSAITEDGTYYIIAEYIPPNGLSEQERKMFVPDIIQDLSFEAIQAICEAAIKDTKYHNLISEIAAPDVA
jgi:hypothetical protein